MSTIRFNLRTDKALKNGQCPIELIYSISGQRKYYNTGFKLFPQNWDSDIQKAQSIDRKTAKVKAKGIDYDILLSQKEADEVNEKLDSLKNSIGVMEKRYKMDGITYDVEMIIDNLKLAKAKTTKKTEPSKILYDFIDKYINDHTKTRNIGSLGVYQSMKKHLESYEKATRKSITFEKIDHSFFLSFQNYLLTLKKEVKGVDHPLMNNITVAKQLSTLKTFLNYAKMQGVNINERFKDFKIKKESLEVIALTNDEFETLFKIDLSNNKRLEQVRDVFCFSCATGLRYSDLKQLKREHIKNGEIKLTIQKTKEPLTIPITPYSLFILAKYYKLSKPLPIISNQKMNEYLKELCKIAEINEPIEIVRYRGVERIAIVYPKYELIGVHTGRKTFATLSLEKGMSAERVMAITGHKDYKSFQRYIKVTEQEKKVAMGKAWGEINTNQLKAI